MIRKGLRLDCLQAGNLYMCRISERPVFVLSVENKKSNNPKGGVIEWIEVKAEVYNKVTGENVPYFPVDYMLEEW